MRHISLLVMTCPLLFGCGPDDGPQGKYFGGQPVDHWLADVRSPNPKTRKKAAEVLGNVGPGDARSIPALIEAVKDADPGVRDAAVLGLSKIGPPAASAESILAEAATDKDPAVRAHAATALKRVRGTE